MKSKSKPKFEASEEDKDLFREAIGEVKPVQAKHLHFRHEIVRLSRKKREELEQETPPEFYFPNDVPPEEVDHNALLFFTQNGLNYRTLRELKQGKIPYEAVLDLHGLIVNEAEQRLYQFLEMSQAQGLRCVCIIHGKGYRNLAAPNPILKNKVNHWLRNSDKVLAFCSALPKDGGTGAIYLILKKK